MSIAAPAEMLHAAFGYSPGCPMNHALWQLGLTYDSSAKVITIAVVAAGDARPCETRTGAGDNLGVSLRSGMV